jgi:FlaA1/EpsC-like NDP-sugar epimerase
MLIFLVDLALCIATGWLAFALRLGEWSVVPIRFARYEAVALVGFALGVLLMHPYRSVLRFSGREVMLQLFWTCALMSLAVGVALLTLRLDSIPRTLAVIHPLLFYFAAAAARLLIANGLMVAANSSEPSRTGKRVLIFGAGTAGQQLAASMRHEKSLTCVGFVDENRSFRGSLLEGKPIWHVSELEKLLRLEAIEEVFLALPTSKRSTRRAIIENIRQVAPSVRIRVLPSISQIAYDRVSISELREVQIEELLGRDEVPPDPALMFRNIEGRVVLVTGAGGSIGSELCRQIVKLRPQALVLADQSEHALYSIDVELSELVSAQGNDTEIFAELVNVADQEQCRRLFERWKPHTVYHAAAYKHVPLVELNPLNGIRNNIFGTLHAALAAERVGTRKFVLVSTDKAVRPTNVMGASKRVCELIVQARARAQSATSFVSVRFGNVLGSSGSVVPRFRQQIAAGGPVTITHRDATRYFMTIPEASQLVIQAGALGDGGEVLLLDMGQPVRIVDLARAMVELTGLSVIDDDNPDGDIAIEEIGLRKGEKLIEELLIDAPSEATEHPRIIKARESTIDWAALDQQLTRMDRHLAKADAASSVALLRALVPEFTPRTWPGHEVSEDAKILPISQALKEASRAHGAS